MSGRRPPRLLAKTLFVTFSTVAVLLIVVLIVVTLNVRAAALVTATHDENSDVLPAAMSVAVAVTIFPLATTVGSDALKLALPPPSVVTLTKPRKV